MNFLIIISVISVFIVNLLFIDKIYSIVDPPAERSEEAINSVTENKKDVLLFGEETLCNEISDLLYKYKLSSEILLDMNNLDKSRTYNYLVSVNKSDLENLMICSIGIKMMDIKAVLSLCNRQCNKKIYDENQVPYLIGNSLTASDFVYNLLNINHKQET